MISHSELPAPVGAGVYNVYTGAPDAGGTAIPPPPSWAWSRRDSARECGRRMIVQVRPDGWWAKCSRHGLVDSKDLETQR